MERYDVASRIGLSPEIAAQCINETWNYLDKAVRDPNDDQQMHLTHTSRYHWSFVGDARSILIGNWQISRVYAALKQPELAISFAAALELCKTGNIIDLLASAYEGMARAYSIAKDHENARKLIELARTALNSINDEEDRRIYTDQINETEKMVD